MAYGSIITENEWTQPIRVKVLDIGKEKGGLKDSRRKGDGMQTKCVTAGEDKNGYEYALRRVEKFPDATLPEEFSQRIIKDAKVVDGISALLSLRSLITTHYYRVQQKCPMRTPQLMLIP